MIRFTVGDIAKAVGENLISGNPDTLVKGFSIDSRTIIPGQVFIAVRGNNFNGHNFILDAAKKGASGFIVEHIAMKDYPEALDNVIYVDNTRQAMGMIAGEIRKRVHVTVICITGTNGKTTVKNILSSILSSRFKVLRSRGSYNNIIGLSLTLFDLDLSYDVAVLELGSNHPGEIAKLAQIANPDIAVITNIGNGHLENFLDRKGVFVEKMSILNFMSNEAEAFLNKDDDLLAGIDANGTIKFYGTSAGSDFLISGLSRKKNGHHFYINKNKFFIPIEGVHNVYNASAAISVAKSLSMSYGQIKETLKKISLPAMRLERISADEVMFINDSYNANPDSFECALKVLKDSAPGRKKGVVTGGMMELGADSGQLHKMIGRSIATGGIDFLITLGKEARFIADGAIESGMGKPQVLFAANHKDAAGMIQETAEPGTVILLKGSRASKMEEVLKCFTSCCIH